ncbi:MAG: DUF4355 domain-containing protein [Ruminococcus sp.]|nr:DUF4355 domain-containing protein [Ruminococcus sp.]
MSDEFTPIETQEAFDAAIKGRLERCTRSVTDEVTKKFEGWLSPEEAAKSSGEYESRIAELTAQNSELAAKNKAYESSSVKMRIACEAGIPFELADKLSGETEDEIRKDAEKLSRYTRQAAAKAPEFSSDLPVTDTKKAALLSMLHGLK